MKYEGEKDYKHGSKENIGILITNLGTPDKPKKEELRIYEVSDIALGIEES